MKLVVGTKLPPDIARYRTSERSPPFEFEVFQTPYGVSEIAKLTGSKSAPS